MTMTHQLPPRKLRAVVADDEPLARERLRFLLSADDEIEIIAEARNGAEVISLLRSHPIDVLFLDIQMPGRGGFEVIEQIGPERVPVTVFVTAHDQYALRAFEVHALDYLTKPVEPERLQVALIRIKDRIFSQTALENQQRLLEILSTIAGSSGHTAAAQTTDVALLPAAAPSQQLSGAREYPKRLIIPNGQKDTVVNVQEIEWIEAADYYSCLHVGTRSLMLRETVKELAATLDPAQFVRIHRSIIVNMDFVREISREGRGEGAVILTHGRRLRMSKVGWQNLVLVSRTS